MVDDDVHSLLVSYSLVGDICYDAGLQEEEVSMP